MTEEHAHVLAMSIAADSNSRVVIPSYGETVLPGHALFGRVGPVSVVVQSTTFAEEGCYTSPNRPVGALQAVFAERAAKGSALDTRTFTLCHGWLGGWPGVLRNAVAPLAQLLQNPERPCLGPLCSHVVVSAPRKIILTPNLPGVRVGILELPPSYQRWPGVPKEGRLQCGVVVEDNANRAVSDAQAPQHANGFL